MKSLLALVLIIFLSSVVRCHESRFTIANPSDLNFQERYGDSAPNISPFLLNCDSDSDVPWHDPLLGTFAREPDKYCKSDCLRNLVCCHPSPVDRLAVRFILTNPENQTLVGRFDDHGFKKYFQKNRRVAFITHGFANNYLQFNPVNESRDGFLNLGYDTIIVDWHFADAVYGQSIDNLRVIGAMIGYMISEHELESKALCVGFSLGAHLCGEAGKWLQKHGKRLSECHLLDPAAPGFDGCGDELVASRNDCDLVLALHTSQNTSHHNPFQILLTQGYGTRYKAGHCDFWINDALMWKHPDCLSLHPQLFHYTNYFNTSKIINFSFHFSCSHHRVVDVYNSQLRGGCLFTGIESTNCGHVRECKPIDGGMTMDMPPLATRCDSSMDKDFRVSAKSSRYPFC